MQRCGKCGTDYEVSNEFGTPGEIRVASCRACPAGNVFVVCERCEDLSKIELDSCPGCGAWNMWEIQKMDPVY
jgi:hypothetical protein